MFSHYESSPLKLNVLGAVNLINMSLEFIKWELRALYE